MLRRPFRAVMLGMLVGWSAASGAMDPQDAQGSEDPPVFRRITGFHLYRSEVLERDSREILVAQGRSRMFEGRVHRAIYYANEGIRRPGGRQITRTYAEAAKAAGGKVIHEYEDGGVHHVIVSVPRGRAEAWFDVFAPTNDSYVVDMIEVQTSLTDASSSTPAATGTTATDTSSGTPATTGTTAGTAAPSATTPAVAGPRVIRTAGDCSLRATDSVLIFNSDTALRLRLPAAEDGRTLTIKTHLSSEQAMIATTDLGDIAVGPGYAVTIVYSTTLSTWLVVSKN